MKANPDRIVSRRLRSRPDLSASCHQRVVHLLRNAQRLPALNMDVGECNSLHWSSDNPAPGSIVRPAAITWLLVWLWSDKHDGWRFVHLPPSDRPRSISTASVSEMVACQLNIEYSLRFESGSFDSIYVPKAIGENGLMAFAAVMKERLQELPPLDDGYVLRASEGHDTVTDWAYSLACGERQLRRQLKKCIDLSPIAVLRIQRFRRLLNLPHQWHDLVCLAGEGGFTDQAHMNREVRDGTGLTPGDWFKTAKDLQPPWLGCYGLDGQVDSMRLPTSKRRRRR